MYNIIYNVLSNLKEDNETLQLYIDILEKENVTIESLQENLNNIINDLESKKDNYIETNIITISTYAHNGKTIKTEVLNNNGSGITFSCIKDSKTNEIEIQIVNNRSESVQIGYTTTINIKNEVKRNEGNINLNIDLNYNQDDIKLIESAMSSTTGISSVYKDISVKLNFSVSDISDEYAKITSDGEYNGISIYTFEGELKKGGEYQIEDITNENSVIVNTCSDEELTNTVTPIKTKISDVVLQKAEMVVPGISLLLNSLSTTTSMESPIYMVYTDSGEVSQIIVELNNALFECFNAYLKAYRANSDADISIYINEEKIKSYCPNAKAIVFTDTGIRYTTNEGKIYEGTVDTDIDDGDITVVDVKEVKQ